MTRRFARRLMVAAVWTCIAGTYVTDSRSQGAADSSQITFEVEEQIDQTMDDGSSLHVALKGRYRLATVEEVAPIRQFDPGEVKDGDQFTIYLKYLGGQLLHGSGVGQGHPVKIFDCSAPKKVYWHTADGSLVEDKRAGMGHITGPTSDGSVELQLSAGAFNWFPCDMKPGEEYGDWFTELAGSCWLGDLPKATISYADLHHLTDLDRTWSGPMATDIPGCHGTGTVHIRATGPPEDVEAILIPDDEFNESKYVDWIPMAGADENTPGNSIRVKVELQKKGKPGQKPHTKAKSFKFELVGTSQEPGVCLNWPPKSKAKDDFDLKIDQAKNGTLTVDPNSKGQTATIERSGMDSSGVTITSYDQGGWGSLQVTAVLEDDRTVIAHLQNKPDSKTLSIPKDDNNNYIADAWERQKLSKGASAKETADDDTGVWQELPQGDGLSLYEEYRGFRVHGTFLRTDPAVPDVFVYDQDDMGTANFAESGLAIHVVDSDEIAFEVDSDPAVKNMCVINFNGHNAHLGKQHAIWLKNGDPGSGLAGIDIGGPGPPRTSLAVKIGLDAMGKAGMNGNYIAATISHELAHAANVWHHGDKDYDVTQVWKLGAAGEWSEIWPERSCLPPKTCKYGVAAKGQQESGVEDCMMRYESTYFYEWDQGPLRWNKNGQMQRGDFYGPAQSSGRRYCRDLVGTGVNATSHQPVPIAGNASRGGCLSQFCVNDLKACIGSPK